MAQALDSPIVSSDDSIAPIKIVISRGNNQKGQPKDWQKNCAIYLASVASLFQSLNRIPIYQ